LDEIEDLSPCKSNT
jgi:hypothetical protein